jgi:hypothetical protein
LAIGTIEGAPRTVECLHGAPFAALLPACTLADISAAESAAMSLITIGCKEMCCVGPLAEQLHDSLDCVIEDIERYEILTTWRQDIDEGHEYFFTAAGGGIIDLAAFVLDCPEIAEHVRILATRRYRAGGRDA